MNQRDSAFKAPQDFCGLIWSEDRGWHCYLVGPFPGREGNVKHLSSRKFKVELRQLERRLPTLPAGDLKTDLQGKAEKMRLVLRTCLQYKRQKLIPAKMIRDHNQLANLVPEGSA